MSRFETNFNEAMELPRPYHLQPYEEVVGQLLGLKDHDESVIAQIGRKYVMLPAGIEETLKHHLGQKIAILRTDLLDKPYLLHVLHANQAETSQVKALCTQICEAL